MPPTIRTVTTTNVRRLLQLLQVLLRNNDLISNFIAIIHALARILADDILGLLCVKAGTFRHPLCSGEVHCSCSSGQQKHERISWSRWFERRVLCQDSLSKLETERDEELDSFMQHVTKHPGLSMGWVGLVLALLLQLLLRAMTLQMQPLLGLAEKQEEVVDKHNLQPGSLVGLESRAS